MTTTKRPSSVRPYLISVFDMPQPWAKLGSHDPAGCLHILNARSKDEALAKGLQEHGKCAGGAGAREMCRWCRSCGDIKAMSERAKRICTWKDCMEGAEYPEIDASGRLWADLCVNHHEALDTPILHVFNGTTRFGEWYEVWLLAQGGENVVRQNKQMVQQ